MWFTANSFNSLGKHSMHNQSSKRNLAARECSMWPTLSTRWTPRAVRIHSIRSQTGEILSAHEEIQGSAIFFQDLLSAPAQAAGLISPDIIPSLITQEDNQELNRPPSLAKVREAVFNIDVDSVAGPDEFTSYFFQQCWKIVQDDVFRIVLNFFDGGHLPRGFSTTSIVLLPKRDNALAD
ncbi:Uncharacterized protein Adt_45817 [Abeliophyllum distichum]|uniref:Uncharacterized protein n=1 Tax=Abeliophyllum distichum TaxID=126358 RepID=A0ABD1NN96_9LAMI